jgi:hypothetical protein
MGAKRWLMGVVIPDNRDQPGHIVQTLRRDEAKFRQCPRSALASMVRCRIGSSRPRCIASADCCSFVFKFKVVLRPRTRRGFGAAVAWWFGRLPRGPENQGLGPEGTGQDLGCLGLDLIHRSMSDFAIHPIIGEADSILSRTRAALAPAKPVLRFLGRINPLAKLAAKR